jgi:hypothetical protein
VAVAVVWGRGSAGGGGDVAIDVVDRVDIVGDLSTGFINSVGVFLLCAVNIYFSGNSLSCCSPSHSHCNTEDEEGSKADEGSQ